MPVLDRIFPGLVLVFAEQQLLANADWVAIHKDRVYEDVRVPSKPEFPYGIIKKSSPGRIWLWTGRNREYIGKMVTRVHIYSVRSYANGAGTWMDFADSFHAMRDSLTGISCVNVTYQGDVVGTVFQSRFVGELQYADQDDDVETLYHGIAIEVIHK